MTDALNKIILAIALVSLSGCIGPSGGPESAIPNSTALVDDLIRSSGNVTSYKFTTYDSISAEFLNLTEGYSLEDRLSYILREDGAISIGTDGSQSMLKVSQESSMNSQRYENLSTSLSRDYYIINNTRYERVDNNWTRLFLPYPDYELLRENRLFLQLDIINRSKAEILGSESVDGTDCWKLRISPDNSTIQAAIIALEVSNILGIPPQLLLAMFNTTELERNSSIEWFAWVSKVDHHLLKKTGTLEAKITPEVLSITSPSVRFEINVNTEESMRFFDYNKPLEIDVPEEAKTAVMLIPVINATSQGVTNG